MSHAWALPTYHAETGRTVEFRYVRCGVHVLSADPLTPRRWRLEVWGGVTLPSGEKVYEIMGWEAVMAIKARSKAASSGPWMTDPLEMGRKTVVRRIVKRLPWNSDSNVVERLYGLQEQEDASFDVGDVSGRGEIAERPEHPAPQTGMARLKGKVMPKEAPETSQGTEAPQAGGKASKVENAPDPVDVQTVPPDPADVCPVCGLVDTTLRGQMTEKHGCPSCNGKPRVM